MDETSNDKANALTGEIRGTRYVVTIVVFDDDAKALEDLLDDNDFEYSIESS